MQSILTRCITVWYGNCHASNRRALQRIVWTAERVIGSSLPTLQVIYTSLGKPLTSWLTRITLPTNCLPPFHPEDDSASSGTGRLQEDEPQQGRLQEVAARIIQKTWRGYMASEVFRYFKELIFYCKQQDPKTILKTVNPREAELLDAAAGVFIRFRLGGAAQKTTPSKVVGSLWPRRPTKAQLSQRMTNQVGTSAWRTIVGGCSVTRWFWHVSLQRSVLTKKMDFHYSKLQRNQDLESWRKRKKIEWLKQMYKEGRLQDHAEHRHMAALVESSTQELMETVEKKGDDEILEWELDELLAWTNTLNFEEYMEEWRHLACSYSSELSKDGPSHPPRLDPHELADENAVEQT
ncbi:protein MFI [Haplochromis burtoni]|uniref:protein MFI n=1 Tax=Haplochromis burtoni TaxID=8153 RepID=UPI001C2D01B6|nr:protein MFI [Haplochromis burtoni]